MKPYSRFGLATLIMFLSVTGAVLPLSFPRDVALETPRGNATAQADATCSHRVLATILEAWAPTEAQAHLNEELPDIAERSMKSVVNIASTKAISPRGPRGGNPFFDDPFFRKYFDAPGMHEPLRQRKQHSLGSGVVVSSDGVVLTNNHVIADAEEITVTLSDGREFDAEIVGSDPKSDLAVLRLHGNFGELAPLPFADSSKVKLAQVVLAIGNPFGVGQTVTMGIVSATGRANLGLAEYENFIQTDAAINPGNSGGALLNIDGELVGINTAIASRSGGYQGVGFAIPSNMAKSIMNSLLENGRVVRGWLGVLIQEIDSDMAEALGLERPGGVLVADVTKDSPAAKAGMKRGDVIKKVGAVEVESVSHLRNLIASSDAGSRVRITVLRDGKETVVKVVLGELSDDDQRVGGTAATANRLGGLALIALDEKSREAYDIPEDVEKGAVVASVATDSAAERAGLRRGDVIIELDRRPVSGPKSFATAFRSAGDRVLLLVYRSGGTSFVVLNKSKHKK